MLQNVPECIQPSCAASMYKRNNITCQDITSCFATINFTAKGNISTAGDIKFTNSAKCDSYKSQIEDNGAGISNNTDTSTADSGLSKTAIYAIAGRGGVGALLVVIKATSPEEENIS